MFLVLGFLWAILGIWVYSFRLPAFIFWLLLNFYSFIQFVWDPEVSSKYSLGFFVVGVVVIVGLWQLRTKNNQPSSSPICKYIWINCIVRCNICFSPWMEGFWWQKYQILRNQKQKYQNSQEYLTKCKAKPLFSWHL